MSPFHRGMVKWARTLHLYTTLFALFLILFFAITGFLLNHEDWLPTGIPQERTQTGSIPVEMLRGPDKLAIVELLRKNYGAHGAMDSFELEGDSYQVIFKGPGRIFEATIARESGKAELTSKSRGVLGIMLDMHRGKSTGMAWSLIIDGVCVGLLVVSVTGLMLWWSLRGRGHYGFLWLGLGAALGIGIYFVFVP